MHARSVFDPDATCPALRDPEATAFTTRHDT